MKKANFNECVYLAILAISFLLFTPALAETTDPATSTPETSTSTPDITISSSTPEAENTSTTPENTPSVDLFLRYQDQIIYNGKIDLTTTTYHDNINDTDYDLNSNTVFSALVLADKQSDNFIISDAQYNSVYNSFYLACLAFTTSTASSTENGCYNWNYAVNGTYPSIGMDAYELNGGETVYVYFSNPWKISASTSSLPVNTTTTFETWRYQFDNLNEPWILDGDNLVDISVPNPNPPNLWDTTITVTTTQTNSTGSVEYSFATTGTYYAKIISLDWSKWSNPISITVTENTNVDTITTSTTSTPPDNNSGSGSSGSGETDNTQTSAVNQERINGAVQKIINFLKSKQADNGSIEDLGMSDWAAIALGSNGIYSKSIKSGSNSLYDYIYNTPVDSSDPLNICAAYPRHILALLASGVDKNDNKITDLKNKITQECLANGTVGQAGINDDVFILIGMLAAGTSVDDPITQAAINTIKLDQQSNGAFTWNGWPSQDITGAAVNALKYAQTNGGAIDQSIYDKAVDYLKTTQLADGGWGFAATSDNLTTVWAMYGINALSQNQQQWTNSQNKNPWSVLTNNLGTDGYYQASFSPDGIDWFATKHAIPALLGKSWPVILDPITQTSGSGQTIDQTTPAPTSTPSTTLAAITTTTPEFATYTSSTLPALIVSSTPDEPVLQKNITTMLPVKNKAVTKLIYAKQNQIRQNLTHASTSISGTNTPSSDKAEEILDQIPLDSPTRKMAKRILEISGGSAVALGLFLGLKFLKNVV